MRKYLTILILFLISASFYFYKPVKKYPYNLAVCAIFKNEEPWLKEWIDYHRVLGVEHFYLYNNNSTDRFAALLEPYINKGIVEIIDWNFSGGAFEPIQTAAYNDCLQMRAYGQAKWVAIIDIDEFIVPAAGVKSFHNLLRKMEREKRGSLRMNWKMFGTSNVWDLAPQELLIENLTLRAKEEIEENKHVKSIHRPEAVEFCYIHHAHLKKGFKKKKLPLDKFRIHHYWARTGKSCMEKRGLTVENSKGFLESLNQVEDKTIFQYLQQLKVQS